MYSLSIKHSKYLLMAGFIVYLFILSINSNGPYKYIYIYIYIYKYIYIYDDINSLGTHPSDKQTS